MAETAFTLNDAIPALLLEFQPAAVAADFVVSDVLIESGFQAAAPEWEQDWWSVSMFFAKATTIPYVIMAPYRAWDRS